MTLRLALVAVGALIFYGCARVGIPPGKPEVEDKEPPRLKKVEAVDAYHVEVTFSEPVDDKKARDAENYVLQSEYNVPLAVKAVVPAAAATVILVTDKQEAGLEYSLTVRNVTDATGGNAIQRDNVREFKGSKDADERLPAVVATFPADGASDVGLFPEIIIDFSDVMADGVEGAVALYDDLGESIPVVTRAQGQRLRCRAPKRLDYATKYVFIVKDTCSDLAGNLLVREHRFAFTTVEDEDEGIITGKVRAATENVSPAGIEVRLALSADPLDDGAKVVGYATTDGEGNFVLTGVPPNNEAVPTYYLVATADTDGDGEEDLIGGYGFAAGKSAALPTFVGGEKLENVEVVLWPRDAAGPSVTEAVVSPKVLLGQDECYVRAKFTDGEGAAITAAEVFFDRIWSDGTGVQLFPVVGEWGTSPVMEGERVVFNLESWGVTKEGPHIAYFHGRDAAGNWGEFTQVPFELTSAPRPARKITGNVAFEKAPCPRALVTATPEGELYPTAFSTTDEVGYYRLEKLRPGRYAVRGLYDEDEDGRWRPGEPSGAAAGIADVTVADATAVSFALSYGPTIGTANARVQYYGAGPGIESRAVLSLSASVSDRDLDLKRVWAKLPDGSELELADDGVAPDAAAGDGIFTRSEVFDDISKVPTGAVVVAAVDGRGNALEVSDKTFGGLTASKLTPPAEVSVAVERESLNVAWSPVAGARGGYVVFVIPAERLSRFTEAGTAEVFSNVGNPTFDTKLTIPFAAMRDWWAYPPRAQFVVMVVASAGDAPNFQDSDKAVMTTEWFKPIPRR